MLEASASRIRNIYCLIGQAFPIEAPQRIILFRGRTMYQLLKIGKIKENMRFLYLNPP